MDLNTYQQLAQRTSNSMNALQHIKNGCYGMCGEAGECIDILKKHEFQGHVLEYDKLLDELGDVLWYIAETASGLDVTLENIALHNIEKLKKRYPNGFEAERSVNRE